MARSRTKPELKSVQYERLANILVREALERTAASGITGDVLRVRLKEIALELANPDDPVHENWQGRPDVKLALQFVSRSELKDAIAVAIDIALDPTVVHLFPAGENGALWMSGRRLLKNAKAS